MKVAALSARLANALKPSIQIEPCELHKLKSWSQFREDPNGDAGVSR